MHRQRNAAANLGDEGQPLTPPSTAVKPRATRPTTEPSPPAQEISAELLESYEANGRELVKELEKVKEGISDDQQPSVLDGIPRQLGDLDDQTVKDLRIRVRQFKQVASSLAPQLKMHHATTNAGDQANLGDLTRDVGFMDLGHDGDRTSSRSPSPTASQNMQPHHNRGSESPTPEALPINPEEQAARAEVIELDSRITLPQDAQVTGLCNEARYLLAAMRSPLALEQLAELLNEEPYVLGNDESLGEDGNDLDSRIILICRKIQVAERDIQRARFHFQYFNLQLYLTMKQRQIRNQQTRNHPDDIKKVADLCHWSPRQLRYHLDLGKKLHLLSGGHNYLFAIIPFTSNNHFEVGPTNMISQMTDDQASKVGLCMRDTWGRLMCALGRQVKSLVVFGFSKEHIDPRCMDLLRPDRDFRTVTASEIQVALGPSDEQPSLTCTCGDN